MVSTPLGAGGKHTGSSAPTQPETSWFPHTTLGVGGSGTRGGAGAPPKRTAGGGRVGGEWYTPAQVHPLNTVSTCDIVSPHLWVGGTRQLSTVRRHATQCARSNAPAEQRAHGVYAEPFAPLFTTQGVTGVCFSVSRGGSYHLSDSEGSESRFGEGPSVSP